MKKLLCFLFLFCCFLKAQTSFFKEKDQLLKHYFLKIGPFYLAPALLIKDLGYDYNIYYFEKDKTPDWTADLGINLRVFSIVKNRLILQVDEQPVYVFYLRHEDERTFNNYFTARAITYVNVFTISASYRNINARERPTWEFGPRARRHLDEVKITLDYNPFSPFSISGYYTRRKINYEDERYLATYNLKKALNRTEDQFGIKLLKKVFTRTFIFLEFSRTRYQFEYEEMGRNSDGKAASVGVVLPEIGPVRGTFQYGYKELIPEDPEKTQYKGPFGNAQIVVTLARRIKLRFEYLRDTFFSFWGNSVFFDENRAGGTLELYLSRNFKVGTSYSAGKMEFPAFRAYYDDEGNLIKETREDIFKNFSVFMAFRVFRTIGVGLSYSTLKIDSTLSHLNRERTFIGGFLTHEF